uniref:hypothetical protein n=1 Tax=Brachybacterium sp. GPGPB12 TaxID=3023517 RepID=UPI00404AF2ED
MTSATDTAGHAAAATDPHASIYDHGFVRVAAVTLPVALADPAANAEHHLEVFARPARPAGRDRGLPRAVPDRLLPRRSRPAGAAAGRGRAGSAHRARGERGADADHRARRPARAKDRSRIFNCGVVIHRGRVLGVTPKQNLPTYREFYERRWFAPGDDAAGESVRLGGEEHALSPHSIITVEDVPGRACSSRSARTCGCRSRRRPRPRSPAPP